MKAGAYWICSICNILPMLALDKAVFHWSMFFSIVSQFGRQNNAPLHICAYSNPWNLWTGILCNSRGELKLLIRWFWDEKATLDYVGESSVIPSVLFSFEKAFLFIWLPQVLVAAHGLPRLHGLQQLQHGLSCSPGCGILVPWPRMEPASPVLQGRFLTTRSLRTF